MSAHRRPSALAALALAAVSIAACAGGQPGGGQPASESAPPAHALECQQQHYPCSLTEVDGAVRERSGALAGEAAARVRGGAPTADVAAWLEGQSSVVEAVAGPGGIRFRLDGGRPTWVLPREEAERSAAKSGSPIGWPGIEAGRQAPAAPRPERGDEAVTADAILHRVVGPEREQKRAMVISPYAWDIGADASSAVAQILGETRGYEGRVSYLANGSATDTTVSVNTWAHLPGNDVVYIRTMGGMVCPEDAPHCFKVLAAHDIPNPNWIADDVGLQLIAWNQGGYAIGLSADFFWQNTPGGIEDAILLIDVPDMYEVDLLLAMTGSSSDLFVWDGPRDPVAGAAAVKKVVARLAETGRTVKSVYEELRADMAVGNSRFVGVKPMAGGVNRIREVVWALDPETGAELQSGDKIRVIGDLGDGKPDKVPFQIAIDGQADDDHAHTSVTGAVDQVYSDPFNPNDGEQIDDFTYVMKGEIEVPDLTEGQQIEFQALAQLAEGGNSRQTVTLTVTGKPDLGRVWQGVATARSTSIWPGVYFTRTASVTFVRDRWEEPDDTRVKFYLTEGTFDWQIDGTSENCSYQGSHHTVLHDDEQDRIVFDLETDVPGQVAYHGEGDLADGPVINVLIDCGDWSVDYRTGAEGVWWMLPQDEAIEFNGGTLSGSWTSGEEGDIQTTYTWNFTRVE